MILLGAITGGRNVTPDSEPPPARGVVAERTRSSAAAPPRNRSPTSPGPASSNRPPSRPTSLGPSGPWMVATLVVIGSSSGDRLRRCHDAALERVAEDRDGALDALLERQVPGAADQPLETAVVDDRGERQLVRLGGDEGRC